MNQRYVFTLLASLGNLLSLCGRDSMRLTVLLMRQEYLKCSSPDNSSRSYHLPDNHPYLASDTNAYPYLASDTNPHPYLASDNENRINLTAVNVQENTVFNVSAFNIGVMITGVGGAFCDVFSGKKIMTVVGIVQGICNILIPTSAAICLPILLFNQFVSGLAGGFVCACLTSMLARWEPSCERGLLSTIIYTASPGCLVMTSLLTGITSQITNWRSQYYGFGVIQLAWLVPWWFLVHDSPDIHPRINEKEKRLLLDHTDIAVSRPSISQIPLLRILLSPPVWGQIAANMGNIWVKSFYELLPQYLEELGVKMMFNGFVSALPPLGSVIMGLLASRLFNWANSTHISLSLARKISSSICLFGFSVLTASIPLLGPEPPTFIIFVTTAAYFLTGFHLVGAMNNAIDLSPNYVGTILGINSFFMYLTSTTVSYSKVIALQVLDESQVWPALFILSCIIATSSNIVFLLLGSSELQDWNMTAEPVKTVEDLNANISEIITEKSSTPNYGSANQYLID
ncbi:sialin isoform X2 [Eurytemora carolleeae]|uniref:sialin isoform X2 n=1 Tax=Eurytemora carolleeae TaxID=1294199 RepID=UPI000C7708B1|nr:sialin isoform X2 [Eurytemora carolleeae]|eukprot:XP_023338234.1 sialin-like isoform X2 [Eurytemora affinis]